MAARLSQPLPCEGLYQVIFRRPLPMDDREFTNCSPIFIEMGEFYLWKLRSIYFPAERFSQILLTGSQFLSVFRRSHHFKSQKITYGYDSNEPLGLLQ